MARKLKTMERDFWFNLNPTGGSSIANSERYIDLAQIASLVNRVSLRQGMEYVVESMELISNGNAFALIQRLPEHWSCINAWEKAFHHWKEQQDETAREAGLESTRARYRDFKVFFDIEHVTQNVANNLIPMSYVTASGASATEAYEWNPSQFVLPNAGGSATAVEVYGHMLGDDDAATPIQSSSCGLIHAYAESRSRPFQTDPNIVDVNAENTLFGNMVDVAEIMDDVMTNYQEHNHTPPYLIDDDTQYEFYPGGANQANDAWVTNGFGPEGQVEGILNVRSNVSGASATTGWGSHKMSGFVAPLGLLKVTYGANNLDDTSSAPLPAQYLPSLMLRVTLAPGGYKGLLAQGMREAN